MLTIEKQKKILNALSNDLSLLKYTKNPVYKLTENDFEGNYRKWFNLLLQASKRGYNSINSETIEKLAPGLGITIVDVKDPKTEVLNVMDNFFDYKAIHFFHKTMDEINNLFNMARDTTDRKQYNEIIDKIIDKMNKFSRSHKRISICWNSRSAMEVLNNDFHFEEDAERIPTYLPELDEVLGNGFYRAGLHVISAFPHNGKTTCAVQFATMQATQGYRVLYISLEQNAIDILENVLSVLAENPEYDRSFWDVSKLKSAELAEEKKEIAKELIMKYIKDFLHIDDTNFEGIDSVVERIRFACEEENFDIVYIDNFQNVKIKGEKTNEFERFADELLSIAKEHKVPIICLSQLTQDAKGNKKTKWSAKLNENAVTNIEIYRVIPNFDLEGLDADQINIKILKNRKGKGFLKEDLKFGFLSERSIICSLRNK
jgi:replicative DNA helicase